MSRIHNIAFSVIIQIILTAHCTQYNDFLEAYQAGIPKYCWHHPPGVNISNCCHIPSGYTDEEFDACGIMDPEDDPPKVLECTKSMCLLKNSNQLNEDESINYINMAKHIREWAKKTPHLEEGALIAINKCVLDNQPPKGLLFIYESYRPDLCEPDRIYSCLIDIIIWHCKMKDTAECADLKSHMQQCKIYYDQKFDTNIPESQYSKNI